MQLNVYDEEYISTTAFTQQFNHIFLIINLRNATTAINMDISQHNVKIFQYADIATLPIIRQTAATSPKPQSLNVVTVTEVIKPGIMTALVGLRKDRGYES
jgi:hypothetical protein